MTDTPSKAVNILLIEDNEGDIFLTRKAFEKASFSYEIHIARDGEEALDFVFQRGNFAVKPRPDIIFLDMNMPKKDGKDVLKEIKEDESLRRIPVIILTSSKAEQDVLRAYDLHANSYMVKPLDLGKFQETVQAVENFWFKTVVLPDE
ncbi:MAG: hypothetical protein CMH32_04510 [Micavibrio sp.]|nr:hypothetical protein [Micavibrio sp.]HCK32625.1 hypothetical protein [Rhodospirillaceae bacterium]|tara:strand:- start:480 stop:923 length:444 start_codon:yes stop_codon:yes gene_type:complete